MVKSQGTNDTNNQDDRFSPVYIAFYTANTPYEHEIKRLRTSLEKFNLPHEIDAIPSLGSWQKNTHYKAIFIQNKLYKHKQRSVVYLDADAEIVSYPHLFMDLNCDMAAHYLVNERREDKELLSGTLYFGQTQKAKKLIELWRYVNQEYPERWEQRNLEIALKFVPDLNVFPLPPSYCHIFDSLAEEPPVINHYQASRLYKNPSIPKENT